MGCKTQKSGNFKHITQILNECINCFEFEKSSLSTDVSLSNIQLVKQALLQKGNLSQQNIEQLKMKPFQQHALIRMIQLFIIKAQTVEFDKAIFVYNMLLRILQFSSNDRRHVICDELLHNLSINTFKELCWITTDNPLFVDINKQFTQEEIENDSRPQSDSQGNSSSSGNSASQIQALLRAGNREQAVSLQIDRSSLNKLIEEKYIVQNTIQALIQCIDDVTTSFEIKLSCLKLVQKFITYVTEDDFQTIEFDEEQISYKRITPTENKNEWAKIMTSLQKVYDPLSEPDFAFVVLEIFYQILGLQYHNQDYQILCSDIHAQIILTLIRSLQYIQSYIYKQHEQEFLRDPEAYNKGLLSRQTFIIFKEKFQSLGGIPQKQLQAKHIKASKSMSNVDGLGLTEIETSQKTLTKLSKKIISIIGFCFALDKSHKIWSEPISDRTHSVRSMHPSIESTKDIKLIEFLLDQFTLVAMNDFMYPKLCHHLLICLQNISDSLEFNHDSELFKPQIIDYLIYLNTRLGFPYMLNRQEFLDPIVRLKNNYQRLNKSLKEIFKDQFLIDDVLYCNMLLNNQEYLNVRMNLVLTNLSSLLKIAKNEDVLNALLTFLSQKIDVAERHKFSKDKQKELRKQEKELTCLIDVLSQMLLWNTHSSFDRNCDIRLKEEKGEALHHFVWNRNILSVSQKANHQYFVYVRNPAFNYIAVVQTINKKGQSSKGSKEQVRNLNALLKNETIDIKEEIKTDVNPIDIVFDDNTLMAMLDPFSLLAYKKQKDLMLVEDDLILRSYLDILDHIQPKDCYSFGVFYIPRETEASSLKSMTDLINFDVNSTQVTHSFVHFLSMLGSIVNVKDSHQAGNNYLYLNNLGDDFKDEKLIINEDDTNFIIYFSNLLNKESLGKSQNFNNLIAKVVVIFNESNMQTFTHLDPSKVFLIFSKLSDEAYLYQIQHLRNKQIKHHRLQTIKSEMFQNVGMEDIRESNMKAQSLQRDLSQVQVNQDQHSKKYQNGHVCESSMVHKDKIGDFVKRISVLSDIFDRQHRYGKGCIISNIMQRGMKIKEIKEKRITHSKFTTIMK